MEPIAINVLASASGFMLVGALGVKLAIPFLGAYFGRSKESDDDYLELMVNGKDYSVDLKSIGNGGSVKIKAALQEAERCH